MPGQLVARVVAQSQERQDVLDVGALDEPRPGEELELDAGLGQRELQVDRVVVGAVEHGDVARRAALGDEVGDALDDEARLVAHRREVRDHRARPGGRPCGAQALAEGVAGGERRLGEPDHLGGRAVIGLEREDPRARDGGEALHHLGIGAAPGVDRLVRVGNGQQVAALPRDRLHQPRLHRIRVVQLVHQDPAVGVGELRADARVLVEQARGQDQQVGVVDRRHRALALGVALGDGRQVVQAVAQARVGVEHHGLEGPPALGRQRGPAHDRAGLRQRRAALAALQEGVAGDGGDLGLVLGVEHREGRRQADQRAVAGQQPPADRVEGAGRDRRQVVLGHPPGAVDHVAGGPARERDEHDRLGRRAGLHQVGQRRDDRAGLARARRGQHQRAPARALDGGELLGVEHRPQARGGLRRRRAGRPQAVDRAPGRVGRERVAGRAGVAQRLLGLDVRQGRGRRLPARISLGRRHGRGTLSGHSDGPARASRSR